MCLFIVLKKRKENLYKVRKIKEKENKNCLCPKRPITTADVWKENALEELEAGEFLAKIRREFSGGEEESVKAVELRKMEQGGKIMEEFVQEFKRAARGSGYEGRLLVEEFKREMNRTIRRKLMKAEDQPGSIEQWHRRATALDINQRESRREEEKLRGRKEPMGGALRQEPRQIWPRPLVWQRRQMPPQQVPTRSALIEGVERMNVVMVRGLGQGIGVPPRGDPYVMEVDKGRNCYTCGRFGHLAHHCKNQGGKVAEGRRMEYNGEREELFEYENNLKGEENLDILN